MPTTTSTSAKTRTKPQANTRSGRRTLRNPRSKSEGEDEKDEARPLGKKTQTKKTPPARPRSAHVAREREDANEEQEQQVEEEMIGSDKAKSAAGGRSGVKAAAGRVKRSLEDDDVESTPVTGREAKAKANGARKRKVYDSDALDDDYEEDDDDEEEEQEQEGGKDAASEKRKRGPAASSSKTPSRSPRKTKKQRRSRGDAEEDLDVEDGQEVVGVVVQAPKTGRVPAGQVSQNTLDFLTMLKDPECNDREWQVVISFKLHEPVYRQAEQEWKDFVQAFTDNITEADSQIPHLPAKDVIYRIYRDIRFSNDKTPYKTNFSATFSRSGRKGIFAGYHIMVQPGNGSLIAAGSWCPGKNEIATIRSNIQRNSRRLREVISDPEFVSYFGEPKPRKDGERRNIFGMEDELKTAPKGVDKNHRDIDLLKCRSFVVLHRFLDSEVLQPDFREKLADVARVMKPLVHCLNDYMTVSNNDSDDDDDDDGDADAAESGGDGPASE